MKKMRTSSILKDAFQQPESARIHGKREQTAAHGCENHTARAFHPKMMKSK
jgi:hypothetical protein